ncbi:hypothetical protein E2P81_ATG11664 [Venturia nashicola]|uniref:Uncharacterized protein n=1 Tax=Venturia nashicola TaxID=86259 RepID=A0A4Z1NS63_9PEZI|nr:hypothetical protein E6O75_ATG11356 [Venturia nashicola]TLD18754.1 hypothetical protein E2P81_ATG11664 [Venturia nashicola]
MATVTPAFLFQIDRIEETPGIRPRLSQHGFWLPPRTLFGSQIKEGHTTRKLFCFNGKTVTNWEDELPSAAVLHRQISMYHSAGHFFIVPYDATRNQVGNGRQVDRGAGFDDDDEDAEADEDSEVDPTTVDWSVLSFHWKGEAYTSEAMIDARWHRLNTQRPDQAWVQELLPDSHHAEHSRHTREPKYGALNGDLAILIALVAFSGHASFVERAVKHCIRHVHGENGGWRTHNQPRHQGWQEKRGVRVKVWSYPPYSTNIHLRSVERGDYGAIYR